jgi:hypothetical protein
MTERGQTFSKARVLRIKMKTLKLGGYYGKWDV